MKKLIISLLVVAGLNGVIQAGRDERDKWDSAIDQADLASVKKLLRRFEGQEATPEQKKRTLKELVGSANDGVDTCANMSVLNNKWDLLKLTGGAVLVGSGLVGAFIARPRYFQRGRLREGSSTLYAGCGLAIAVAGMCLAFKGFTCTTQQNQLKEAKRIETLLKDKLESLDSPVGPDLQKVTK